MIKILIIFKAPYIFCFSGIELGARGENKTTKDLHVLNINTFEWKIIMSKVAPYDRCDFVWNKLGLKSNKALLYGGSSCPSEIYHDDLWLFNYDESNNFLEDGKKEINRELFIEIHQKVI